jgi:hypothetical protein
MLNLIIRLKKFSPVAAIKRRLKTSELILDFIYYYKTKEIFKDRSFKAFRRYEIDFKKDLALVFFVGIGDAIYGLPALLELRKKLHANGAKLHAYIEEVASNFNNPAVYQILKSAEIFDSIKFFHGRKLPYWKYFDWTSIKVPRDVRILPFIYRTNHKIKNRIVENFDQLSLTPSISWPDFKSGDDKTFQSLAEVISAANNKNIFIHLETRSGNYRYPFLNDFLDLVVNSKLLNNKFTLVVFKSKNQINIQSEKYVFKEKSEVISYKNFEVIGFENGNKIIFIDPMCIELNDQIVLIKDYCNILFAINSYLWPISTMLKKELVGVHYLDSADGHQFLDGKSLLITPSYLVHKKMENSILALEGTDYLRVPSNPLMVEYFPSTLYWIFLQKANLS